jgi:hypothetical protein
VIKKSVAAKPEQHFISGIYNYCDRWCERCSMTSSCLLFALENADARNSPEFFDRLESRLDLLSDLMILLNDTGHCESEIWDADLEQESLPARKNAMHELIKRASDYAREVEVWLDSNKPFLDSIDQAYEQRNRQGHFFESNDNGYLASAKALEEIAWYRILIQSKLFRSLSSRRRERLEGSGQPSDSSGSAKVALIGIQRSRRAWTRIAAGSSELKQSIATILETLERLEEGIDQEFPDARVFERPGFDSGTAPEAPIPPC